MDLGIENDAREAVKKIYDEYLTNRYQNDPGQRLHRLLGFDTGHYAPSDVDALAKAHDTYFQTVRAAGTELQATDAARDALYGQFDREQILKTEVDPKLYRTNPDYYNRMNATIEQKVEEKRQERQQQEPANTSGLKASLEAEPQEQQRPQIAMDQVRFATDPNYRNQIDNQERVNREQQEKQRDSAGTDDRAAARGKYEQLLQKDSATLAQRGDTRAVYEQSLQKDSAQPDERANAREVWEKSLKGENPTKAIEQDSQNPQRNRDLDRAGNF